MNEEELKEEILKECSEILKDRIRKQNNGKGYEGDEFWNNYTFFDKDNITRIAVDKSFQKGKLEERERFKKMFLEIESKYPEHYWRWKFFGKVLFPDGEKKDG